MRTHEEVSTTAQNQSGLIASKIIENPGVPSGQNTATVSAVNVIARGVLDSLKSGGLLKGTVRSNSKIGEIEAVWVVIEIPTIGERQILVRADETLQIGQDVMIECIPTLSDTKRYVFRMANGILTPPAAKA